MCRKRLILILRIYYLPKCQTDCHRGPCNPEEGIPFPFPEKRRNEPTSRRKRPPLHEVLEKLRKREVRPKCFPLVREAELDKTVQRLYGPTSTRRAAKNLPAIKGKRPLH